MNEVARIVILGCGYAGLAIARRAREQGLDVLTNVRSPARAAALREAGFEVLERPALDAAIGKELDRRTHVVVAFPPDGATDALIAPALASAAGITYVSSTGVYGAHRGVVDDATPVPAETERSAKLLAAESAYRAVGAVVLRCPALYGPDRGLHARVIRGEHRLPGDGAGFTSRIHVADLAQIVVALALAAETATSGEGRPVKGETYVVGDLEPAQQVEVVRFVCESYGVPMPPSVPLESVHESLRGDRRVDASRVLRDLGISLIYPTYREGMSPSPPATGLGQAGR